MRRIACDEPKAATTDDAVALESQFSPAFAAADIMNTPNYNAVMRVLADGTPTPAFSVATLPPPASDMGKVARIMAESQARYGRPRMEVELEITRRYEKPTPTRPPLPPLG